MLLMVIGVLENVEIFFWMREEMMEGTMEEMIKEMI